MGRLQDKVCIITGRGGRVKARSRSNCSPGKGPRSSPPISKPVERRRFKHRFASHPDQIIYVHTDVTIESDLERLVGAAIERFGRIDVLFNNHGRNGRQSVSGNDH